MKTLITSSAFVLLAVFSCQISAGYAADLSVNRYYVGIDGYVYFGTTSQPINTCSSWGEYFRFDASTPGGKNMLATLMSAKLAGKKVIVWYTDMAAAYVGTNQTSGCGAGTMSKLTNIGIR